MATLSIPVELPTVDPLADLVIEPTFDRLLSGEGFPPLPAFTRRPLARHAQRRATRRERLARRLGFAS